MKRKGDIVNEKNARDGTIHFVLLHHDSELDRLFTTIVSQSVFDPVPQDTSEQLVDGWFVNIVDAEARCEQLTQKRDVIGQQEPRS